MNILVTAGPTREYIDDVRFLSNGSSGKMGYSIVDECLRRGHFVRLVSGPVHLTTPEGVDVFSAVTAADMLKHVEENISWCDALIMCAAVSDFKPVERFLGKIRKSEMPLEIRLKPNPDILKKIAGLKGDRIYIGFAAESGSALESAQRKLAEKKLDMIVANDISRADAGFGTDTNKIEIIDDKGLIEDYPVMSKEFAAGKVVDWLESRAG